jgi:hypothetical protein
MAQEDGYKPKTTKYTKDTKGKNVINRLKQRKPQRGRVRKVRRDFISEVKNEV